MVLNGCIPVLPTLTSGHTIGPSSARHKPLLSSVRARLRLLRQSVGIVSTVQPPYRRKSRTMQESQRLQLVSCSKDVSGSCGVCAESEGVLGPIGNSVPRKDEMTCGSGWEIESQSIPRLFLLPPCRRANHASITSSSSEIPSWIMHAMSKVINQ